MIRTMDDFAGTDGGGNLVASNFNDPFSSPLNVAALSLSTVADGPSDFNAPGSLDGSASIGQVFAFSLTAGVTYAFAERPTATGGIEDAFMRLYNSSGSLVTYDDDGGAGRSSLLTFTPTTSGTYYIAAGSWVNEFSTGGDVGNFTLDMWKSTDADAGATIATATSIGLGTTFGITSTGSDVDTYQITLTQGQYYTFGYSGGYDGAGETGNISTISLLDSAGHVIASNLNYESAMGYLPTQSGTYYVQVSPYANTHGGYTLDVAAVNPADYDPLDAIRWKSASNIPTQVVDGVTTATIYFAAAGDSLGQLGDDGHTMVTLGWTARQIQQVLNALNTSYSPITGIHYVQTTDEANATFRINTDHSTQYGAYFDPRDPSMGTSQGVGIFNVDSGGFTIPASLDQGGFSYAVLLHEFGHAHGLAHPHDNGGGSDVMLGVNGSQGSYGVYDLNQGVYTVMSYNDAWPLDPDGTETLTRAGVGYGWSGSLGAFDIAALQERYGVHDFNTGNDTYMISDDQAHAFYQTIWDTGGNDTIAYAGTKNVQIDLTAATLDYTPTGGGVVSFAHGIYGGYTIANGVVIENATGGGGDDVLIGNSVANTLTGNAGADTLMGRDGNDTLIGGAGNDTLDGGNGVDTASYAGATGGVTVNLAAGTASGADGNDTLISIENVIGSKFDDRIIGDNGNNVIRAGAGYDVVTLGGGNDTYVADQGAKVSTKAGMISLDIITDFTTGQDKIDLSGIAALGALNFRNDAANKNVGDVTYKTYDSVNGAEHALGIDIHSHYSGDLSGPVTVVFADTDHKAGADMAIILLNHDGVSASDFLLAA